MKHYKIINTTEFEQIEKEKLTATIIQELFGIQHNIDSKKVTI